MVVLLTKIDRARVWLVALLCEVAEEGERLHKRERARLKLINVQPGGSLKKTVVDLLHRR